MNGFQIDTFVDQRRPALETKGLADVDVSDPYSFIQLLRL
jgi:hypothetical protein